MKVNETELKNYLNKKGSNVTDIRINEIKNAPIITIHIIMGKYIITTISFTLVNNKIHSFMGQGDVYLINLIDKFMRGERK